MCHLERAFSSPWRLAWAAVLSERCGRIRLHVGDRACGPGQYSRADGKFARERIGFPNREVPRGTYLFYMAWNILRDGQTFWEAEEKARVSAIRVIINGALLNVLNPKLLLFFVAFLPQFVSAELVCLTVMLVCLALVFMVFTFIIFVVYGACAFLARTYALSRPIVLRWSGGICRCFWASWP